MRKGWPSLVSFSASGNFSCMSSKLMGTLGVIRLFARSRCMFLASEAAVLESRLPPAPRTLEARSTKASRGFMLGVATACWRILAFVDSMTSWARMCQY